MQGFFTFLQQNPFLLLFFVGYGYMGMLSLLQTAGGKRLTEVWRRSGAVAQP